MVPSENDDTGIIQRDVDLRPIIAKAREIQKIWQKYSFRERKRLIRRMCPLIVDNADRISGTIAKCTGKTRFDALSLEVVPSALAVDYYGRKAGRFLKKRSIGGGNLFFFNKHSYLLHEPWGVIAIITPWNYPFGISFHEVVMGLMAGNAVLLKVATLAYPVGECIKEIVEQAGVPRGLFQLISLNGPEAGTAFIDAGVDKLFFTGSISIGRELMRRASEKLIPVCLELGGNDAMIVCKDALLDRATNGALWGGLCNCGQSCGGVQRIYIHESIADRFSALLAEKLMRLRIGHETAFDVDVGALTSLKQYEILKMQVAEALEQGARIIASAGVDDKDRLLHPVMLIDRVKPQMQLMSDETFGPILMLDTFTADDEVIAKANATIYGLTASIWTCNINHARQLARHLDAGVVTINDHLVSHGLAETPWGGYKQSGIGRSHGQPGFEEMTQIKVVVDDFLHFFPKNLWWYPHSELLYQSLKGILDLFYGKSVGKRLAGLGKTLRMLPRWLRKW